MKAIHGNGIPVEEVSVRRCILQMLIVLAMFGCAAAFAYEGEDFTVELTEEQQELIGDPAMLESDVVILRDGAILYGSVLELPDVHYPSADISFEIAEMGGIAVSLKAQQVQYVTRNGQNFIGDLHDDSITFLEVVPEAEEDCSCDEWNEPEEYDEWEEELIAEGEGEESLNPIPDVLLLTDVDTIVFRHRGESNPLIDPRISSIVLHSGDRFPAIITSYRIAVTDGNRRYHVSTRAINELRFNGRLYGWLKGEALARELPPVYVIEPELEIELAKNGQRLFLPWEAIAVIKGDGGRFVTETPYLLPPGLPHNMAFVAGGTFILGDAKREYADNGLSTLNGLSHYPASHIPTTKSTHDMIPTSPSPGILLEMPPFYIDRFEVTNADYQQFIKTTGHRPPVHWPEGKMPADIAEHPVVNVSYDDAQAFAIWMGKRIPTEVEWERAAKGASGFSYPYGPRYVPHFANTEGSGTKPVGSYAQIIRKAAPNPLTLAEDLFDLSGNVAEWTSSNFNTDLSALNQNSAPYNPYYESPRGVFKVVRGGSYVSSGPTASTTHRVRMHHDDLNAYTGFRCVRDVEKPSQN